MIASIYYVVKGKFIRCTTADNIDFVKFEEVFEDENPILAREKAFEYFENYIDVLLDSKENFLDRFKPQYSTEKYVPISDLPHNPELSAIEELEERLKHLSKYNSDSDSNYRDHIDIYNGIGIYLVMNVPIHPSDAKVENYEPEDYPIYGIDFNGDVFYPEVLIDGLTSEFEYYKHFNYDTKDYAINIKYHYSGKKEAEEEKILETPFDWDELYARESILVPQPEQELLQGDPRPTDEQSIHPYKSSLFQLSSFSAESFIDLLGKGEGKQIEYKSTLLFNPESYNGIKGKAVIAKTICSFLNSCGGYLLIGVNDNGVPIGLTSDFKRSNKNNPKDFFKLEFDKMIRSFISKKIHQYVNSDFIEIEGKDVYMIIIEPSDRPVFMNWQNEKLFYIRSGGTSSEQLTDVEEIISYCLDQKNFLKTS